MRKKENVPNQNSLGSALNKCDPMADTMVVIWVNSSPWLGVEYLSEALECTGGSMGGWGSARYFSHQALRGIPGQRACNENFKYLSRRVKYCRIAKHNKAPSFLLSVE
jgi:hypothetical protein